jgi:hypothetical protein
MLNGWGWKGSLFFFSLPNIANSLMQATKSLTTSLFLSTSIDQFWQ